MEFARQMQRLKQRIDDSALRQKLIGNTGNNNPGNEVWQIAAGLKDLFKRIIVNLIDHQSNRIGSGNVKISFSTLSITVFLTRVPNL